MWKWENTLKIIYRKQGLIRRINDIASVMLRILAVYPNKDVTRVFTEKITCMASLRSHDSKCDEQNPEYVWWNVMRLLFWGRTKKKIENVKCLETIGKEEMKVVENKKYIKNKEINPKEKEDMNEWKMMAEIKPWRREWRKIGKRKRWKLKSGKL